MSGFIEGENRHQSTMFPERIDDYVGEDSEVQGAALGYLERMIQSKEILAPCDILLSEEPI